MTLGQMWLILKVYRAAVDFHFVAAGAQSEETSLGHEEWRGACG